MQFQNQNMDKFIEFLIITTLPVILLLAAILAFKQRLGAIRAGVLLVILAISFIISTILAYSANLSHSYIFEASDSISNIYQDIACFDLMFLCVLAVYIIVKIVHSTR